MNIRRKIFFIIFGLAVILSCFFYAYNQIYFEVGSASDPKTISIESGDNALVVGEKLSNAKIIAGKYQFVAYLWFTHKLHLIVAGVYEFPKGINGPEAASIITGGQVVPMRVKATFPEGWTFKQMSERLNNIGLDGTGFASIASNPAPELISAYPFLAGMAKGATLEGFLFPDTYYFAKDVTADEIVRKMLDTFSIKVMTAIKSDLDAQNKSLFEIMTMASVVEGEVRNDSDRKIVAGLFWNRIANGMPLQSDATLEYVLGTNDFQHSIAQTKTDSPYNTYQNKGLPPGPVNNPGVASVLATLEPQKTDYVYFLTDPKTGKTVFAKTFDEHVANKNKYGL